MLKNYILIALRKLSREKIYVLINIFSLALGLGSFLILALYLRSELTYDQHFADHERIYRITTHFREPTNEGDHFALSQLGLGPMLVKDFPQLGEYVRFQRVGQRDQPVVLTYGDMQQEWENVFLADANVFDLLTHDVLYGDPKTALQDPYSIAISETAARHYFGDANPIGKKFGRGGQTFAVTLVFADLPENTHLRYDALLSMRLIEVFSPGITKNYANTLFNVSVYTYLKAPPQFEPAEFESIIARFADTYMKERMTQFKTTFTARLQPLAAIHFGEKLDGDRPIGNIFYVYGFAAVAAFVLLIACINYMNLATARATKRAKEVGMRKVLGASHPQLIGQFLGESLTFTVIALILAMVLIEVALALTPIGALMGKEHLLDARFDSDVLGGILVLSLFVALLSGLYPAFYLAAISPLAALTQVKRSWKAGFSMRQVLVFAQLSISVGVIASTLLMTNQMRYLHDKPLGFDKENRLIVTLRGYDVVKNIKTIKSELKRQPGVLDVTTIGLVPGTGSFINLIPTETNEGTMEPISMDRIMVGMNFVQAMNIEVVQGRAFSEDIATDVREAVMVNESFVRKMGWDEPIGKRFGTEANRFARVIGVVKDFHYASLHNAVGPMMMHPIVESYDRVPEARKGVLTSSIIVSLSGDSVATGMDAVREVLGNFDPNLNFEPRFLDDRLNELYESEANLMKLTGIFSGICILISVMGLFGLSAFATEQRTKEIGIRKVLGAKDGQIVSLLSKHLLWLVIAAAIPAALVSYYAIEKWMQRFAYRTGIDWTTFIVATVVVTLVALLTVALQSLKTASAEPVDALRYE